MALATLYDVAQCSRVYVCFTNKFCIYFGHLGSVSLTGLVDVTAD